MKFVAFISLVILLGTCAAYMTSCQALPQLYQTAEDIANDDIIDITVSKGVMQKETDMRVSIEILNKESTQIVAK